MTEQNGAFIKITNEEVYRRLVLVEKRTTKLMVADAISISLILAIFLRIYLN